MHLDNLLTLKAILISIEARLDDEMQTSDKDQQQTKRNQSIFKLDEISLGIDCDDDKEMCDALKLLRLLYINNLRDLQTSINSILVNVQSITADPKTDITLGRIGRG